MAQKRGQHLETIPASSRLQNTPSIVIPAGEIAWISCEDGLEKVGGEYVSTTYALAIFLATMFECPIRLYSLER